MKELWQKNWLRHGLTVSLTIMLVIGISITGVSRGWAADFPKRPVTIIVPYKAGGGSEVETRNVASVIQKYLGQPFVLKAMPGGGATAGASA